MLAGSLLFFTIDPPTLTTVVTLRVFRSGSSRDWLVRSISRRPGPESRRPRRRSRNISDTLGAVRPLVFSSASTRRRHLRTGGLGFPSPRPSRIMFETFVATASALSPKTQKPLRLSTRGGLARSMGRSRSDRTNGLVREANAMPPQLPRSMPLTPSLRPRAASTFHHSHRKAAGTLRLLAPVTSTPSCGRFLADCDRLPRLQSGTRDARYYLHVCIAHGPTRD